MGWINMNLINYRNKSKRDNMHKNWWNKLVRKINKFLAELVQQKIIIFKSYLIINKSI